MTYPGYPSQQPGPPPAGVPAQGYAVPATGLAPPPMHHPASEHPLGPYPGQPATPAAPNGAPLADFGTRLGAYLIDYLIIQGVFLVIGVPIFIVVMVVVIASSSADGAFADPTTQVVTIVLIELALLPLLILVQYVYEVEIAKRTGQTFGKRLLKLRVVALDPALQVGRGALARRWLVKSVGGLVPGLSLADGLWQLWDQPHRQCLHDKFARTVVVKVPG